MFGGGGMNPRKMKQMMKQMGIDVTELDADEVVIRTQDEDLVFDAPQVTRMDAQGQQTYQIVGDPESRERGTAGAVEGDTAAVDADEETSAEPAEAAGEAGGEAAIPEADVETVAQRAGVSKSDARKALEAENGDLAAAIMRLE